VNLLGSSLYPVIRESDSPAVKGKTLKLKKRGSVDSSMSDVLIRGSQTANSSIRSSPANRDKQQQDSTPKTAVGLRQSIKDANGRNLMIKETRD
jgi:hypothetical protein